MPSVPDQSLAVRALAQQGYYESTPDELRRLDPGLRFTPLVLLVLTVAGLLLRLPALHLGLAVLGLAAFVAPAHPLDWLFNVAVRRAFGWERLPANPLPRRLAMLGAGVLNLAICAGFATGRDGLAYGLGALLVTLQLVLATTHFCAVSWSFGRFVAWRHRPAEAVDGAEARRLVAAGALLVDVRSPKEFATGHLPGAVNVPVNELSAHVAELVEQHRPLVLYCAAGVRCHKAAELLRAAGASGVHELGTLARWQEGS